MSKSTSNFQSNVFINNVSYVELCQLCLKKSKTLKDVNNTDSDGVTIKDKLKNCVYIQDNSLDEIFTFVCEACYNELNKLHSFKQQCLENLNFLKGYIQKINERNTSFIQILEPEVSINTNHSCENNLNIVKNETISESEDYEDNFENDTQNCTEFVNVKEEIDVDYELFEKEISNGDVKNEENKLLDNTNVEKIKCDLCNKSFVSRKYLKCHMRIHTGGRPFKSLEATSNLLSEKSKEKYEKCYAFFCDWRTKKNVEGVDENIVLAYFFEKAKIVKVSTLWSSYSMLKSTLQVNENVDISKYKQLHTFLKRQNDGYQVKRSKVLTMHNVLKFLNEASDEHFLLTKVALIFGVNGACRCEELRTLNVDDIEDTGSILVVTLRDAKTKKKRIFTVTSDLGGVYGLELYRKYLSLRPEFVNHRRFFLFYKNGKCSVQPVGIHSFTNMPRKIAEYLQLPDSNSYTGHCLRRSSAALLADTGTGITDGQVRKSYGEWRLSSSIIDADVQNNSISNKVVRIFNHHQVNV